MFIKDNGATADKQGMTIVNPLASSNLVVQANMATGRPEERQLDLRVEQIVQATVVEGGLDKATLELNQQRFPVQTDRQLQTGQQLKLQVLTITPDLSFKLLAESVEQRLAALLPLMTRSFDWHGLLTQLKQGAPMRSQPLQQAIEQLSQILRPPAELPQHELMEVAVALGQLRRSEPLFTGPNAPELSRVFDRVMTTFSRRIDSFELPQQLKLMALQIRQHPELMKQLAATGQEQIDTLLARIETPPLLLTPQQTRPLAAELKALLSHSRVLPQALDVSAQKLQTLMAQDQAPAAAEEFELSPALLGQLQELGEQLEVAAKSGTSWPQELEQSVRQVLETLRPLMTPPDILEHGAQLGLLGQLFGLNLEAELLRGRTREALSGLKLALLGDREPLGNKGEEALHRLELFQVCRARLADQNQLFVPLPLAFLDEGFLLVEADRRDGGQRKPGDDVTRMSLHLRLSALGNLRIDMLAEPSGMLLRVACEDQVRAAYLQAQSERLQTRLQGLPVRGISFTAGAISPARELLQRIVPEARGMLDARV